MKSSSNELVLKRGVHPVIYKKSTRKAADVSAFLSQNDKGRMRVFVAGGSRPGKDPIYVQQAFCLGQVIARKNFRLDFGFSSCGIMGAVAKGMQDEWTLKNPHQKLPIFGITTKEYLAFEKEDDFLSGIEKVIVARTLEERKRQLLKADFVVFAPGGVGTLDELVYDCVAMQDGLLPFKPFFLFNVQGFFYHIMEYLKALHDERFASAVPFIVVDDATEASVAFDALPFYYNKKDTKQEALKNVRRLIHDLPYIIAQHANGKKSIERIVKSIKKQGSTLQDAVEEAYLNKETERMYDRLAHSGRDTAAISDKLTALKKKRIKQGG